MPMKPVLSEATISKLMRLCGAITKHLTSQVIDAALRLAHAHLTV